MNEGWADQSIAVGGLGHIYPEAIAILAFIMA